MNCDYKIWQQKQIAWHKILVYTQFKINYVLFIKINCIWKFEKKLNKLTWSSEIQSLVNLTLFQKWMND